MPRFNLIGQKIAKKALISPRHALFSSTLKGKIMDTKSFNFIMSRVSVRSYKKNAPLSREDLTALVRAGMAAPSACDRRTQRFVAVNDAAQIATLAQVHPYAGYMLDSGTVIVVCGDLDCALPEAQEFWAQDCAASTENILLAAETMGFGSVWCGVYPVVEMVQAISSVLELPENIIPFSLIVVGRPEGEEPPKDKWDASKLHWQKW